MKRASHALFIFTFTVLLGFSSVFAAAEQDRSQRELDDLRIENIQILMQVEHIQLSFLVRDNQGRYIKNLKATDFLIQENGQEQKIALLKEQEVPINAVIMVDTSWSIGYFFDNAVRTAVDFFKGLEKEKSAFVLFSEECQPVLGWDDPPIDLGAYLHGMKPKGKTALYDSVIWVADNLFKDRGGKKLIILLTDGIDTKSSSSFEDMIEVTRHHGITLYPIIYTNEYIQNYRNGLDRTNTLGIRRRVSRDFHNLIILQNRFVDQTLRYGGRTIFSNAFADLRQIYMDIIHEMKSQYVMIYQTSFDDDKNRREVKVSTRKVPGKIFINIDQ
ncbi:MAG: VWA domain-containing protein [Acidobacteria bacterium]|nr:VWA domain-containing protein [Acidobacteriota bacterium]